MMARIGPASFEERALAGSSFRAIYPRSRVTSPQRPAPAVQSVGTRAAEAPPERRALLHPPATPRPERGARFHALLERMPARWVERVMSWYQAYRDRQSLASLDDRMLRDLGIGRAEVESDSATSF